MKTLRTLAAFLALALPALLQAAPVPAAEYTVRQCLGAGHHGFEASPSILGGIDRVSFVVGCTGGVPGQVGVHQDRSGGGMSDGVGGEFRWSAPPESRIVSTRFDLKMKDANGILANPVGRDSEGGVILDDGEPHDGSQVIVRWTNRSNPLSWVAARLICRRAAGCPNQPDVTKAFITVFDAEFTLRDTTPPAVSPRGSIWDWADGHWHRGTGNLAALAGDGGGGVSRLWAELNGTSRNIGLVICPGSLGSYSISTVPCLQQVDRSESFNTGSTPFREGLNSLRICAEDFLTGPGAPNRTCSPERTIRIDNQPPDAPVSLHTVGGEEWRAGNGFEFAWAEPGGQVAPVTGGRYRVEDLTTAEVVAEEDFGSEAGGRLGPVAMPGPGEYRVTVRLRDAAGNLGEPASSIGRFDDRPPGDVAPEPQPGWVSADELPLRQVIERAEARGPSGVGGYALAVAGEGPVAPCPGGLCLSPQFALTGGIDDRIGSIPGLAEGSHWVSAVAASGASVPSETPGATEVRVDRTAPRVALAGIPAGWTNRPVTVTATATDALSGMAARPGEDDGEPETVIQADGFSPYRTPGAVASFTVAAEGESQVRYWARDLAGNQADGERGPDGHRHPPPGEAVVRIDTAPPDFTFVRRRDPRDPERIEAAGTDLDSGTAKAAIAFRRAGTADPFTILPTRDGGEGLYFARMPSDSLASGSYELRITGTDRAGNTGTGDRAEDGAPMVLRLPLKEGTVLQAGFGRRTALKTRVGYRSRPRLHGRLTSRQEGLPGEPVTVLETFDAGSHPSRRTSRTRTDGTGRFALRLRPGPSRRVRLLYPGTATRARAYSRNLRIESSGRITLDLDPVKLHNGGRVTMTGRVARRGALVPSRGKLVAIQFLDPRRSRWRPVEVLRTRRDGRFLFRYRFRTIVSAQRIIFRAVALPEAGWPYLHSTTGRRSVIVFPRR